MPGKSDTERMERLEFHLVTLGEEVEKRLHTLERRLEIENYALSGLRWVVAVTAAAVIIALVNGWLA